MSVRGSNGKSRKKLAKWLRFYDIVAYIIITIHFLYALGYIIYIGIIINDWKMYLPYKPSRAWLELNSYSLLPSFCALPAAPLLIWQVAARVELSSGDFYGIVGTMLGLAAISLFDSCKTLILYLDNRNNAWSCKHEAENFKTAMQRNVKGNTYTDYQYKLQYISNNSKEIIDLVYEHLKDGYRVKKPTGYVFLAEPDNRTLPFNGTWIEPYTADRGVRWWTHLIQKDFQCCGSVSYKEWEIFEGDIYTDGNTAKLKTKYGNYPPSCYCTFECDHDEVFREKCFRKCGNSASGSNANTLKKRPGCCKHYLKYLHDIYLVTFILTFILGLLYGITICVYIINYAATRTGSDIRTQNDPTLALIESDNEEDYFGKGVKKPNPSNTNKIRSAGQYHAKTDKGNNLLVLSTANLANKAGARNSNVGTMRQTVSDSRVLNKRKITTTST